MAAPTLPPAMPDALLAIPLPAAGWAEDLATQLGLPPDLLADYPFLPYVGLAIGAALVVGLIRWIIATGRQGAPAAGGLMPMTGSGQAKLRRRARRYERGRNFRQAAELYEQIGDLAEAAALYERALAYAEAAGIHERLNQLGQAARLFELGGRLEQAADLYQRAGSHGKAAALYAKTGKEFLAAEAYEKGREYGKAADLFTRLGAHDRAAALLVRDGQFGASAELLERALRLQKAALEREGSVTADRRQAYQEQVRRCGDLYHQVGQPAKAAVVLLEHGLELEAAEAYCRAGELRRGLEIYARHREYDKALAVCARMGAVEESHGILGERLLASGDVAGAAAEFEAAKLYWRAGELYERIRDFARAGEMYFLQGEHERAGEMFAAGQDPARAGEEYGLAGRWGEAARYFRETGAPDRAADALERAGELVEAGLLFKEVGQMEKAIALLQQVPPKAPAYLQATVALGDLFLAQGLYGPAKEKYQRAIALRSISADFVEPYYGLGLIYEQGGQLREAVALFEKVMAERIDHKDVQARVESVRVRLAAAQAAAETTVVLSPKAGGRGRYRIVRELGRGGMGIVYRAEDEILKRPVAYKVLRAAIQGQSKVLEHFLREARIAASLLHPNIVTVYDAQSEGDEVYLVMEYVEGTTLHALLEAKGILEVSEVVRILRQVCAGLQHAHERKIIHRDIKPGNIMVARDGQVKLMDFGLATVLEATAEATAVRGTPYYMAPEQILGREITARTDIYAIGCTLYRMVAGRAPFTQGDVLYHHCHTAPTSPILAGASVPPWLDLLILRCIEKDPADRFPGVSELLAEVERSAPGGPGRA